MGVIDILGGIAEGLATIGMNSYSEEEKKQIISVRDLMRSHGQKEAADALTDVINNFYKGVTRRTPETTTKSSSKISTAEAVVEFRKRLNGKYGSLETVMSYNSEGIKIHLKNYGITEIVSFKINPDMSYCGRTDESSLTKTLFKKEVDTAENDVISILRIIRLM